MSSVSPSSELSEMRVVLETPIGLEFMSEVRAAILRGLFPNFASGLNSHSMEVRRAENGAPTIRPMLF